MKRLLLILLIMLLTSCQTTQNVPESSNTEYDVNVEIERLNDLLKEDNTNDDTYISLFNAYIINNEYFEATRVLDRAVAYAKGDKVSELIIDLKDGYDVCDTNNTFYKRILIDYDKDFDPFYVNQRNVDYYLGNGPLIGGNYDDVTQYVEAYLSSNNQDLYRKSNYTVYLLNEKDTITDIYYHTYSISGKSFNNVNEYHYRVQYNDDGSIDYIIDNTTNNIVDYTSYSTYKDGKIVSSRSIDNDGEVIAETTFEYDDKGYFSKYTSLDYLGSESVEYERYDSGSPSRVVRIATVYESEEIPEINTEHIYEYTEDGRMLLRRETRNGDIGTDEFEYDENNRLIHETSTNNNYPAYNLEYAYTYNDDGYVIRRDNLINTDVHVEYTYSDDYSSVSVCTISGVSLSEDCEVFNLYH